MGDDSVAGDGCTGFWDGTWRACCDLHDTAYTVGGSKLDADLDLLACVFPHSPLAAAVMFIGVTIFGWLWWWRARRAS